MSRTSDTLEDTVRARWVSVCTGFTPGADYTPTASDGDLGPLADEAAQLCKLFHVDPPPPAGTDVHLFWRATTGDWVITRIQRFDSAPRIVLEYFSAVFSEDEFAKIGHNPWRAIRADAHGLVKETFTRFSLDPVTLPAAPLPRLPAPGDAALRTAVSPDRAFTTLFETGGEIEWKPGLAERLETYCDEWSAQVHGSSAPPTFATWWPHAVPVPPGLFLIVLKSPAPKQETALQAAEGLASDLAAITHKFRGAESRRLLDEAVACADAAYAEFRTAQQEVQPDEAGNRDSWTARRNEAAKQAAAAMTKVKAARLALSSRPDSELAPLDDLAKGFDRLALRLSQERYPAVFGRKAQDRADQSPVPRDRKPSDRMDLAPAAREKNGGDRGPVPRTRLETSLLGSSGKNLPTYDAAPKPRRKRLSAPSNKTAILALCGVIAVLAAVAGWYVVTHNHKPNRPDSGHLPDTPGYGGKSSHKKKSHVSSRGGLFSSLNINDNLSPEAKRMARLSILSDQIASTQAEIDRLNDELTNGGRNQGQLQERRVSSLTERLRSALESGFDEHIAKQQTIVDSLKSERAAVPNNSNDSLGTDSQSPEMQKLPQLCKQADDILGRDTKGESDVQNRADGLVQKLTARLTSDTNGLKEDTTALEGYQSKGTNDPNNIRLIDTAQDDVDTAKKNLKSDKTIIAQLQRALKALHTAKPSKSNAPPVPSPAYQTALKELTDLQRQKSEIATASAQRLIGLASGDGASDEVKGLADELRTAMDQKPERATDTAAIQARLADEQRTLTKQQQEQASLKAQ